MRVLATSREALHVAGEVRRPRRAARGSAAVELFLERARAARPGFEPDAEAVALVAEIARRVDGLPLAIELAAARVNVLGLAELVSILERRAALLRDSPASDPARTALQGLVEWSYDLLHGDEKTLLQQLAVHRGGASLAVARRGRSGARPQRGDGRVSRRRAGRQVDRVGLVRRRRRPVRHARHRPRVRARAARRERGARRRPRARTPSTSRRWPRRRASGCAGRNGCAGGRRLSSENDNLWAALAYAREAPDPAVAVRLGTLGWYFTLAERVSEGRRFLELALAATDDDAPVELRVELLADLCYLATEELDTRCCARGGRTRPRARRDRRAPRQLGLAQLTLALAARAVGRRERAAAMAQDASATFEAAGDDWGIAASSLIRATARRSPATSPPSPRWRRRPAVTRRRSSTTRSASRRCSSRRGSRSGGRTARPRRTRTGARSSSPERIGFGDHAAFALAGLGVERARERRPARGRGAPAAGARDRRGGGGAVGRGPGTRPARAQRRGGRRCGAAERLYREVLEWSQAQRPHQARESLFVALAGSPATAALLGLAELAEARGDTAAADEFRDAPASRSPELAGPRPRLAERWQRRRRAFSLSKTDEQEARDEHNHDRGAACGDPPADRPAAGARAGRRGRASSVTSTHCARRRKPFAARSARLPTRSRRSSGS